MLYTGTFRIKGQNLYDRNPQRNNFRWISWLWVSLFLPPCLLVLILWVQIEYRLLHWDLTREITGKNWFCFQLCGADCNNTLVTLITWYEALWKSDLWCFSWLFLDSNLTICRKPSGSKLPFANQLKFF